MEKDSNGWVKLHRSIIDHPDFTDSEWVHLWVYFMCQATHRRYDYRFAGKRITLEPGQFVSGRVKISSETGINESKVRRLIKLMKSDQQIDQQTCNESSLFTIINWTKYQQIDQQIDQPATSQRPASDHLTRT